MRPGRQAAVFLDRDGVLVRARVVEGRPYPIHDASELQLETGAADACRTLSTAGLPLVVVTNQPDVARGTQTMAAVHRIHERLQEMLPLDEIVVCPHDDPDGCACRKPLPGMLVDAAVRLDIDLEASFMIGDRWRDIEAGRRAGCRTVFLDRDYRETVPVDPDARVRDLGEAVAWILAGRSR